MSLQKFLGQVFGRIHTGGCVWNVFIRAHYGKWTDFGNFSLTPSIQFFFFRYLVAPRCSISLQIKSPWLHRRLVISWHLKVSSYKYPLHIRKKFPFQISIVNANNFVLWLIYCGPYFSNITLVE